jgi:hypothetical protein
LTDPTSWFHHPSYEFLVGNPLLALPQERRGAAKCSSLRGT